LKNNTVMMSLVSDWTIRQRGAGKKSGVGGGWPANGSKYGTIGRGQAPQGVVGRWPLREGRNQGAYFKMLKKYFPVRTGDCESRENFRTAV